MQSKHLSGSNTKQLLLLAMREFVSICLGEQGYETQITLRREEKKKETHSMEE